MAKKIYALGTNLLVEDTVSGALEFDVPKQDYYYSLRELYKRNNIRIYNANTKNWQNGQFYEIELSNAVDESETPYTIESFTDFARNNLRQ